MEQKEREKYEQTKEKETKMLSPIIDVVFQALFGEVGCEKITRKFIEAILDKNIEEVDLSQNIVLRRETIKDKMGVLDVLVKVDEKEFCNIEMQLVEQDKLLERILYYWSKIYTRNIKAGEDYNNLRKTIEVLIVNFEIESLRELEYHSKWKIIEEKERKLILTNDLEIHIIELPKIKLEEGKESELIKWLKFLINPESNEVKKYMLENKEMKEAGEKLKEISEDEKMQRIAELRQKAIMDEKAAIRFATKKGIDMGKAEGKMSEKKEIAKKLKEKGTDIKFIQEVTGLTKEEIEEL